MLGSEEEDGKRLNAKHSTVPFFELVYGEFVFVLAIIAKSEVEFEAQAGGEECDEEGG